MEEDDRQRLLDEIRAVGELGDEHATPSHVANIDRHVSNQEDRKVKQVNRASCIAGPLVGGVLGAFLALPCMLVYSPLIIGQQNVTGGFIAMLVAMLTPVGLGMLIGPWAYRRITFWILGY